MIMNRIVALRYRLWSDSDGDVHVWPYLTSIEERRNRQDASGRLGTRRPGAEPVLLVGAIAGG
jgi:hypothetical protein